MQFTGRFKYLAAVLLLLVALPGMAGSLPEKNLAFYVNYDLTLAADGSIEKLVLRDKKLSTLTADFGKIHSQLEVHAGQYRWRAAAYAIHALA